MAKNVNAVSQMVAQMVAEIGADKPVKAQKAKAVLPVKTAKVEVVAPVVAEVKVAKVAKAPKEGVFKVESQGLSFGQWFKLAQNSAAKAGKSVPVAEVAQEFYAAGFSVKEVLKESASK